MVRSESRFTSVLQWLMNILRKAQTLDKLSEIQYIYYGKTDRRTVTIDSSIFRRDIYFLNCKAFSFNEKEKN